MKNKVSIIHVKKLVICAHPGVLEQKKRHTLVRTSLLHYKLKAIDSLFKIIF